MPNFSFLDYVEVAFPGWLGGWPESDNMTILVQLNLIGTGTGTELGKNVKAFRAKLKPWIKENIKI